MVTCSERSISFSNITDFWPDYEQIITRQMLQNIYHNDRSRMPAVIPNNTRWQIPFYIADLLYSRAVQKHW